MTAVTQCRSFAYLLIVAGHTTAVAEYPDNVEPNTQTSKAPTPFCRPWIAFTIYANSLYHNSVKKKIAIAQLTVKDESKLHELLRYKGGVHTWVIWVFGLVPVIGILAAILIPMFARH